MLSHDPGSDNFLGIRTCPESLCPRETPVAWKTRGNLGQNICVFMLVVVEK